MLQHLIMCRCVVKIFSLVYTCNRITLVFHSCIISVFHDGQFKSDLFALNCGEDGAREDLLMLEVVQAMKSMHNNRIECFFVRIWDLSFVFKTSYFPLDTRRFHVLYLFYLRLVFTYTIKRIFLATNNNNNNNNNNNK